MITIKARGEWAVCGNCGHKLFKYNGQSVPSGIEIKCHSCKEINKTTQTWFFTFGCGQEHEGHYVTFDGTYAEAREKMCEQYGDRWAFQYSEEEWESYVEDIKHFGFGVCAETPLEPV